MFRLPVRMLLFVGVAAAYLAAVTTDRLVRDGWGPEARRALGRGLFVAAVVLLPTALGWFQALRADEPRNPDWVVYAVSLAATVPAALWLVPGRTWLWLVALLVDLVAAGGYAVEVRPEAEVYPVTRAEEFLRANARPGDGRVLDYTTEGVGSLLGNGCPLALVRGIETPRGLNGLDVRWYREYVQAVAGERGEVRAYTTYGFAELPNVLPVNPALFDLLGVRYVVAPPNIPLAPAGWPRVADDPGPMSFNLNTGGTRLLPPQLVHENPAALPRAFIVPEAARMPADVLTGLTATDLRNRVLLTTDDPLPPSAGGAFRPAEVADYRANRVAVRLPDGPGGFLVLADVWYPGWVCRVDGVPVPVHRANHAFRAVAVPAGAREAVFTYEPASVRVGGRVSAAALAALALLVLGRAGMTLANRRPGPYP
jgi:hypothetical protein